MTTTRNNGTYAIYEKNVRGFLAIEFRSRSFVRGREDHVNFLGSRAPYQCALAIARSNGLAPG